jgi:hypothetical protein
MPSPFLSQPGKRYGPYPKRQTKKQAWNTGRKEKQTGQKGTERRNYSKELRAGAAALAEKREKPASRTAGGLRSMTAPGTIFPGGDSRNVTGNTSPRFFEELNGGY